MHAPDGEHTPGDITGLLRLAAAQGGNPMDDVLPRVYHELLTIARQRLRHEATGHTLNTAALVHEAWLRMAGQENATFHNREHFFAVASEAMRRVLVDHARRLHAHKRGDGAPPLPLQEDIAAVAEHPMLGDEGAADLLSLDAALDRLAAFNPRGAQVVQQRFFAGLTLPEIADVMGLSERTVRRSWTVTRAWLRRELEDTRPGALAFFGTGDATTS